jgi:uncharacterized protein YdhG (YjbR/CyaY superfamily)
MKKPKDIDEYISSYPREIQKLLEQFRATIKKAAPKAEEAISYGMPAFKFKGILVWFAAHSKHIGFYPRVSAIERFKKELSVYKGAKGSVQFPLDKPLPLGLISKIVKFRVQEDLQRASSPEGGEIVASGRRPPERVK